ncbi:MAG: hypothetical protein JST82_02995 [Bacteroidetes bacterium]|nr:hypothetical protein [Bacteroidota bacterium]
MKTKYIILFLLFVSIQAGLAQQKSASDSPTDKSKTSYKITIQDTGALSKLIASQHGQIAAKPQHATTVSEKHEDIDYPPLGVDDRGDASNFSDKDSDEQLVGGKDDDRNDNTGSSNKGGAMNDAKQPQPVELCFPITRDYFYNVYDYAIYIEDVKVVSKYKTLFDKYQLVYSGYVWEYILKDIIKEAAPAVSKYVVMRSDNRRVLIKIIQRQEVDNFPDYVCKYLTNLSRLEVVIRKIDRKNVPKY